MGSFMNSLFGLLLGWTRGLVQSLWRLLEGESPLLLSTFAKGWVPLCAVMILAGLLIDWLVWVIRWRPYHLLALRIRKRLGLEEKTGRQTGVRAKTPELTPEQMQEAWLPLTPPAIGEEEQQEILERADSVSDEELGSYPGMRYAGTEGETRRFDALPPEETQRYGAVGSAQEAETDPAREEYERQLEQYERERAQYERDLAEYERQMAEYEAAQGSRADETEADAEKPAARRRRRG